MSDKLLFLLSRVESRLATHLKREFRKKGIALSPGQIGILFVLERDGQTTMGHLSQVLDIDNAAISRLVAKLEKQNLVERRINPDDRRQMFIFATESGLNHARKAKKVANAANSMIKQGFTEQEIAIYKKVNQAILEKFKQ